MRFVFQSLSFDSLSSTICFPCERTQEFQKALGSKQPVYDTTVRSGRAMRDKAQLPADTQRLDHLVGEVRDKWDTVCGKSVERYGGSAHSSQLWIRTHV